MRLLKSPNIDKEILADYDCVMEPIDTMGRKWHMAMWPKRGGTVAFFNSLSEMRKWERDVRDLRRSLLGESTSADFRLMLSLERMV